MAYVTHDELESLRDSIDKGFKALNDRFDKLDERTREVEQDVAVLNNTHATQRGWISAIVSAVVSAVTSLVFNHRWQ